MLQYSLGGGYFTRAAGFYILGLQIEEGTSCTSPDIFTEHSLEFQNKTYSRSYIATPRLPLCLFHAHCIDGGGDFKKELHFSFAKIIRTIAIHEGDKLTYL